MTPQLKNIFLNYNHYIDSLWAVFMRSMWILLTVIQENRTILNFN